MHREGERKPGPRTAGSAPLGNGVRGELWADGPQGVGPAPRPQETLRVILTHTHAGCTNLGETTDNMIDILRQVSINDHYFQQISVYHI